MVELSTEWPVQDKPRNIVSELILSSTGFRDLRCCSYMLTPSAEFSYISLALEPKQSRTLSLWIDAFTRVGHTHNIVVSGSSFRTTLYRPLCTQAEKDCIVVCHLVRPPKLERRK